MFREVCPGRPAAPPCAPWMPPRMRRVPTATGEARTRVDTRTPAWPIMLGGNILTGVTAYFSTDPLPELIWLVGLALTHQGAAEAVALPHRLTTSLRLTDGDTDDVVAWDAGVEFLAPWGGTTVIGWAGSAVWPFVRFPIPAQGSRIICRHLNNSTDARIMIATLTIET